ncbi:hypothetical protein [Leeia oryzae]|uniref:hypothetical protein n=1 Tax=Leeia oryzae TaxID=356662 RepID=UPI000376B297|nr:hypothetical protein [Leeia oryzae]
MLIVLLLTGCIPQKAIDTGLWLGGQNGLSFDRNVTRLGKNDWTFTVAISTLGLTSNLQTAIENVTQPYCSGSTSKVVFDALSKGIHNTVTGAQRVAQGRFHCEAL